MPARTRRHLQLLNLARPLRRYAGALHQDRNVSFFLVHQALSAAFAEEPALRSSDSLEASLQDDISRSLAWDGEGPRAAVACRQWT